MTKIESYIYHNNDKTFEGKIAYNSAIIEKKPGVLIFPTWMGQSEFEEEKAIDLANLGYVGFSVDLYGKGNRPKNPTEAGEYMSALNNNREHLRELVLFNLKIFSEHPEVDKNRIGAIGFCFGGKCALDLARASDKIKGVVSFHGILDSPSLKQTFDITSSILILHGWDDPLAKPESVIKIAEELTSRKADWQLLAFGNTSHAFTNPKAMNKDGGMMYNEKSSNRGWQNMKMFFEKTLK